MTITQFRPGHSTRGNILYSKLKPYLVDDMVILDIGCAYACLYPLINSDFPNTDYFGFDNHRAIITELWKKYPEQIWNRLAIKDGSELKDITSPMPALDVAIHIGLDAEWSAIWKVHPWLIENCPPKLALLETGRRDGYEGPMATYNKVVALYIEAGYKRADSGQFDFDWDAQGAKFNKDRHWSILVKQ